MTNDADDFVAGIGGGTDHRPLYASLEEWFQRAGAVGAADVGLALEQRRRELTETLANVDAALRTTLGLLTKTPGQRNVTEAVRLVAAAAAQQFHLPREAASYLAACQVPVDLGAAFVGEPAGDSITELRTCLIQELLLRGVAIRMVPEIDSWLLSQIRPRSDMLDWLPTELLEIEQDPGLPSYSLYGSGYSSRLGPRHYGEPGTPRTAGAPEFVDATDHTDWRTEQAVSEWWHHSKGRSEHRAYDLAQAVSDASAVASSLASFPLDCLAGLRPDDGLVVSSCSPVDVWQVLFDAAAFGGAYSRGVTALTLGQPPGTPSPAWSLPARGQPSERFFTKFLRTRGTSSRLLPSGSAKRAGTLALSASVPTAVALPSWPRRTPTSREIRLVRRTAPISPCRSAP